MSSGIVFEHAPNTFLCALNVSTDCLGFISITTSYVDSSGQTWDVCAPCAHHEMAAVARRDDEAKKE